MRAGEKGPGSFCRRWFGGNKRRDANDEQTGEPSSGRG